MGGRFLSAVASQEFGDLDGVEGGAFAELVAGYEQLEASAVGLGDVLTDAAYQNFVDAAGFDGHGEMLRVALVDHANAGQMV